MAKFDQRKFFVVNFYPFILYVINSFIILLSLPVINFCVIPIFPKLTIRARIGVGVALYCIGNITVVIIHAAALTTGEENVKKPQLWCLLVPIAILAVAEVFTMVSGETCTLLWYNTEHIAIQPSYVSLYTPDMHVIVPFPL